MRNLRISSLIVGLSLAVGILRAEGEFQSWTSVKGTVIEAKLIHVAGEQVVLEGKDGRVITLKKNQLSAESRAQLQVKPEEKMPEKEAPKAAVKPVVEPFEPRPPSPAPSLSLPVEMKATAVERESLSLFEGGRWEGAHAVYQCEKFDAVVNSLGMCHIYLKNDEGLRLTRKHNATIYPFILKKPGARRNIEWVSSREAAQLQPEKLKFSGEAEEGVKFEYTLLFQDETVSWYGHSEKRNASDTENFTVVLRFGAAFGVEHESIGLLTDEEARTIAGNSRITFSGAKDRPDDRWDLWETYSRAGKKKTNPIKHHLVDLEMTSFAPRTIRIETDPKTLRQNRPYLMSYSPKLMISFQIANWKSDIYSEEKGEVMKMTVK